MAVEKLVNAYRGLVDRGAEPERKEELAREICLELSIQDGIDEAIVDHASAEDRIARVECMSPEDDRYDENVIELAECLDRHRTAEPNELLAPHELSPSP